MKRIICALLILSLIFSAALADDLSSLILNYNIKAAAVADAPELDAKSMIHTNDIYYADISGIRIGFQSDLKGCFCIADKSNADAFIRASAALLLTFAGSYDTFDSLSFLMYAYLRSTSSNPFADKVGSCYMTIKCEDDIYSFYLVML